MGHADIATTLNVYTHLKLEDAKGELEQLKAREQLKKEMALVDMENAKRELKRVSAVYNTGRKNRAAVRVVNFTAIGTAFTYQDKK